MCVATSYGMGNPVADCFLQAYLILSTVIGAGVGHYLFSKPGLEGDEKGMACH